jgi:hypothetical protein
VELGFDPDAYGDGDRDLYRRPPLRRRALWTVPLWLMDRRRRWREERQLGRQMSVWRAGSSECEVLEVHLEYLRGSVPDAFAVWLTGPFDRYAYETPSGHLELWQPGTRLHRRAVKNWAQGGLARTPRPESTWLVAGARWNRALAEEAARRWARVVSGRRSVEVRIIG